MPKAVFIIEKGIERAPPKPTVWTSPWADMEIGDSVKCSSPVLAKGNARRASARLEPWRFEDGLDLEGNARVWRVA